MKERINYDLTIECAASGQKSLAGGSSSGVQQYVRWSASVIGWCLGSKCIVCLAIPWVLAII